MADEAKNKPIRDIEVITTHINADFDALASMLAVSRLYPEARLVFPGSQERNLRNFYVESVCYMYNFVKVKDIALEKVKRLILVDTRHRERIGTLAPLADDPEVEVHIYDHHPNSNDDIAGSLEVVEAVGSTVTIISQILQTQGHTLHEDEATLLALGIYEDTGSFTFSSTTQADFAAASWLLSQGAKLSTVSSLITRELTSQEVGVLNDLISYAKQININGVEITISEISVTEYVAELAVLVSKFMDMENLNAIFALARMEDRVYLVARSRIPQVDVGIIAKALGGGGHPSAAAATLREMTLLEARSALMTLLQNQINNVFYARDLMTAQVITIGPRESILEAHEKIVHYGINVLPVVDGERVMGIIPRQIVEKAIMHGLEQQPVSEYMDTRVTAVAPDDDRTVLENIIIQSRQRLVPVMEADRLVGVITRTDILNTLIESPQSQEFTPEKDNLENRFRQKNVISLMRERYSKKIMTILSDMGRVADNMGYSIYLVGGSVRDLFLRRPDVDLDIVVEGDGIEFARAYNLKNHHLRVREHKKFNTAKLLFDDGLVIDVATARLEYYQAPAALPEVIMGPIKLDLYRRDFTINTLAIKLNNGELGTLIDFFDAMRDLRERTIRVLHNLSFVEDPTRAFRAVRFEQRFQFRISKVCEGLIKNALSIQAFERLSGKRLMHELILVLEEERAAACLERLQDLKLLEVFHPSLHIDLKAKKLLARLEEALTWYRLSFLEQPLRAWLVYYLGLIDGLKGSELQKMAARLDLAPKLQAEIKEMSAKAMEVLNRLQWGNSLSPSAVYHLLKPLKPEYLLLIMAKASQEAAKKAVSHYLTVLARERPMINGNIIKEMGFAPGPLYRQILDKVLDARLDGYLVNMLQEVEFVRSEFGDHLDS